MANVSVFEVWQHGLNSVQGLHFLVVAGLTELVETLETRENDLRVEYLLRTTQTMLLACSPKVNDNEVQPMESDKRARTIDNVAAEYLKFRLNPTLREDDAMHCCRVVRDALNIAVAIESGLRSKAKHMKRLHESFPVDEVQDKDELVFPELLLSYRRVFGNCSESWWSTEGTEARKAARTEGTTTRRIAQKAARKRKRKAKGSKSADDIAEATGATCYDQQEVETLESWYHLDNIGVWAGADPTDWECADGMGFLSPWYPRCERPGGDGLAGSLLPTGLASTPWVYPAGMEWLHVEWPEADWSERLQITSWPLGFDEQQPGWHESESIPQETEIPWPERLDLTLIPSGPQEQTDWPKSSWKQAALRNHFEWPQLTDWPVEPQEQGTKRVEDVLSPQDADVPWPQRLGHASCRCDPQSLFPHHLGEPPWSL